MKLFLLVCLLASSSIALAKNKDYLTLYNQYKHIFTNQKSLKGASSFASVGDDAACGYATIQGAIDSGVDEVRIKRFLTFTENLTIQNQSINLIGGYTNCFEANSGFAPVNETIIDGNDLAPVINIDNDNSVYEININNLWIQNGNSGNTFFGGGLEAKGVSTSININNIRVYNNTGSGISVEGVSQLNIKDAYINNNTAVIGGGIACSNTFVTVYGTSFISSNSASSGGGGIYAYNQCNFSFFSGQPHPATASGGIQGNTTMGQGAGIYAYDGATINLNGIELDFGNGNILGDSTMPVTLLNNTASSNGGGLFISGVNTQANLTGVRFQSNLTPSGNGGGIAVLDQATLVVTRYNFPCWNDIKCNYFFFNYSGSGAVDGGAIYAEANSVIGIGNAYFEKNTASFGSAIWITGGTKATIEGSVFTNNNSQIGRLGNYVIGVETGSELILGFNTFVDNLATTTTIALFNSTMTNVGNLFYEYELESILSQTASTVTNNCIVSRNTTGLIGTNITQTTFDPFVDRDIQDFHLDEISGGVAVDLCDTSVYTPSLKDMDHEPRGIDLPIMNTDGPYDVGADEFFIDELFANGFE